MHKYLYLTYPEWANAWTEGGIIPINLASSYKSTDRDGIYTPDETIIDHSSIDKSVLEPAISIEGNHRNIVITNPQIAGKTLPSRIELTRYEDDELILSFCNKKSNFIARELGKRACVKILSIDKLKEAIDKQLGAEGIAKDCMYTSTRNRDHFTKSMEDCWQEEYRIFWNIKTTREVILPKGIAKRVKIKGL